MKNEKAENQKMEDVYNKEYLPSIVKGWTVCIIGKQHYFSLLHFYIPGLDGGSHRIGRLS